MSYGVLLCVYKYLYRSADTPPSNTRFEVGGFTLYKIRARAAAIQNERVVFFRLGNMGLTESRMRVLLGELSVMGGGNTAVIIFLNIVF